MDFGYAVRAGYLGPYRNTRYHLDDFRGREADGYMEKFNYQHSRLRNVVEQSFGKLKARWHILSEVPNYVRPKQVKVVIACFALHNFVEGKNERRAAARNLHRAVDYNLSAWATSVQSEDVSEVRDWIAMGL